MSPLQQTLRRMLRGGRPEAAPAPGGSLPQPVLDRHIIDRVRPFTMTSDERLQALIDAVRYCVRRGIPGAFAECGVWRGGSVLAMVLTLQEEGDEGREIHLFDTFEGMTAPTEHDVSALDPPALETWQAAQEGEERPWSELFHHEIYGEEQVRETLLATRLPVSQPQARPRPGGGHPAAARARRAGPAEAGHGLVRVDAPRAQQLYPRLAAGGVLIIDDYGHWDGARRAVDEYFERQAAPLLLNRIDYTGRIADQTLTGWPERRQRGRRSWPTRSTCGHGVSRRWLK